MTDLPTIRDKHDVEAAQRLVQLGCPAVEDELPVLLEWIRDMNWPVARHLAPFLASVGRPLVPALMRVMKSDDVIWRYWCIHAVIGEMPVDVAADFEPELLRIAENPTPEEVREELEEVALEALRRIAERSGS